LSEACEPAFSSQFPAHEVALERLWRVSPGSPIPKQAFTRHHRPPSPCRKDQSPMTSQDTPADRATSGPVAKRLASIQVLRGVAALAVKWFHLTEVMVDRGAGFVRATGATVVLPGQRVMASANGSATIVYDATCTLALRPGSVVSIQEKAPCLQGSMQQTSGSLKDGVGPSSTSGPSAADAGAAAGPSGTNVALGIAALAAGGALIYVATRPSSP
jgi:hypothetical protein